MQQKKQKEDLLAKRVELKSDRKARAMASRTKDNFRGYNGVPVVEGPKKRRSKLDMQDDKSMDMERFRNNSIDPEDDEDNYEYAQTDSEPEEGLGKHACVSSSCSSSSSSRPSSSKACGPPKSAPPLMNFADLLKLAEKKQFEPVELKPKVVKKEGRLRTAEEIREQEMERKAKRLDKDRDSKVEREREDKSQSGSSSGRKNTLEKEQKFSKSQKNSSEKPGRSNLNSKPTVSDRGNDRPKTHQGDRERSKTNLSSSSGAINSKAHSKVTSQVSAKQVLPKPSSSHKPSTSSDLSFKKESVSGVSGSRPPGTKSQSGISQQTRPVQGGSLKQGSVVGGHKPGRNSGNNSAVKSSGNSLTRPSPGGLSKAASQLQARPGGIPHPKAGGIPQVRPGGAHLMGHPGSSGSRPSGVGPGRPGSGGPVPGRSTGSTGSGPGRPKCTVVSETISSKNVGGPRPGLPPQPGMPQRPGMAPRAGIPPRTMMNRPPGKNRREDDALILVNKFINLI